MNEEIIRYCPECDKISRQSIELLIPGNPEAGEMYVCNICKESTGLVENEKINDRLREIFGLNYRRSELS